eukprot:SAG11_NODE_1662_length_4497_cov_2.281492_2_plen_122_part_00
MSCRKLPTRYAQTAFDRGAAVNFTGTTPLGWLTRMTQFKNKTGAGGVAVLEETKDTAAEGLGTGILTYPVLMAADILLYQATAVPVRPRETSAHTPQACAHLVRYTSESSAVVEPALAARR